MKKRLLAVFMLAMMFILSTSVAYAADYTYGSTTLGATQPSSYKVYPNVRKKSSTTKYFTNKNTYARKTSDETAMKYYTNAWDGDKSNTRASGSSTNYNSGKTANVTLYTAYQKAGVNLQLEVGNPNGVSIDVKGKWNPN
ncbi:MAG: hypothetical protein VB115_09775 [Christensenellaceae bacterium]|nr:hypothetical protein [Christensenellaceae bacterium]